MKQSIIVSIFIFTVSLVSAQNIGIGIDKPTEKLHIAGNVRVDTLKAGSLKVGGNPGAGKILVSDENGNAKWESLQKVIEMEQEKSGDISRARSGITSWCAPGTICGVSSYQDFMNTRAGGINFGNGVFIDGDFAMASSPHEDFGGFSGCGIVYVYRFIEDHWELAQRIIPVKRQSYQYYRVYAMSGKWAVMGQGASGISGRLNVYQLGDDGIWYPFQDIDLEDSYVSSMDIAGEFLAIGKSTMPVTGVGRYGTVDMYRFKGGVWGKFQVLKDNSGRVNGFGHAISIQANQIAIAGSNLGGSITVFDYNGSEWYQASTFDGGLSRIHTLELFNNTLLTGSPDYNMFCGAVSLYLKIPGGDWRFGRLIENPDRRPNDVFGVSIAMNSNYAIISCHRSDDLPTTVDNGSLWLYRLNSEGDLVYHSTLLAPDRESDDNFGSGGIAINEQGYFLSSLVRRIGPTAPYARIMFGKLEY